MRELTIGRLPHNDIVIDDQSVSRSHATLIINGSTYSIRDMGSSNGTFINGMRINGLSNLIENDILKVGNELVPWMNYISMSDPVGFKNEPVKNQNAQNIEQQKLPNSSGALTLGILGLVFSLGLFGIIFNILAISLGAGATSRYKLQPEKYTESSYSQAKAGKVMGIIGLGLFGLGLIIVIGMFS
jgi:pSer/pThr/pTyr-binding forkhead associated (FHA) protein